MPLTIGQTLPDVPLAAITDDGPEERSKDALFAGKKVVLFGVPGAFTPTCNNNHLPGYVEHADAIKARGVDTIAVVSVNDVHVMKAWKEASGAGQAVLFLADGSAIWAKAADLVLDGTDFGMGTRLKRFAALVDDGVVISVAIEDAPGKADDSGATAMLAMLDEQ